MCRCWEVVWFIPFLLAAGCSTATRPSSPGTALPDLPKLTFTDSRIRQAVEKAYRELEAEPNDPGRNGRLGMILHVFEQYDSAEVCYRRARILDPGRSQWAYYLGLLDVINGKTEDAAVALSETVRLDPGYLPAALKLSEALLLLRRLDDSERASRSAIARSPQLAPAYYWLGRVAAARGQQAAAMEHYRTACRLWPAYGTAHYALALLAQSSGDAEEARRHMAAYEKYRAGGDPQPEDPLLEAVRALDNSALTHLMKGVDLEKAGRLGDAIAEHEEAVRQDAKLVQAHANLIALYARAGQPERAEAEYRATVAINPNLPQSHYDYGVFLVSRQRFREAESAFRKALESSPEYAEAHSNLGALLERDGRLADAMEHYRAAVDSKPGFRIAQYQLGRLLLTQHRTAEAIEHLSQTLTQEDTQTPRFLYTLGIAYREAREFARARQTLTDAADRAIALRQPELAAASSSALRKLGH
jgi:tetratricopeptide (TPR) repeat protein